MNDPTSDWSDKTDPKVFYLLKEDGGYLLLETGGKIILEPDPDSDWDNVSDASDNWVDIADPSNT